MTRYEKIDIGSKQFIGRSKRIQQKDLTNDCWMVQVWGLPYCTGFGDPKSACEYLGTEECGGERIRKLILSGEYPREGLPDVGEEKAKKIIGDQNG